MTDVFAVNQRKVAVSTLKMPLGIVGIMGKMNHVQAFKIVFGIDLIPRLEQLMSLYPDASPDSVVTELDLYGWAGYTNWKTLHDFYAR